MGRMMKHQMDHCQAKIRNIQWKLIGCKPQYSAQSVSDKNIVTKHLDGSRKITASVLNKAFKQYVKQQATKQWSHVTIGDCIGQVLLAADNTAAKKEYDKKLAAYEEREKKVNDRAAKCVDQIILGGDEVALGMLEAFANMKL